jgi:hypothetical protein
VGVALWIASGLLAFLTARIIPFATGRRFPELMTAILLAMLAGVTATALDFGGWATADWRAGGFAYFVSLAGVGMLRVIRPRS